MDILNNYTVVSLFVVFKLKLIKSVRKPRVDLPLGSVGLVCASVVSVVASVVSLPVVETVLKETKQLVKQRFD